MNNKRIKPKKKKMQGPKTLPPDNNMMPIAEYGADVNNAIYPWQQYMQQPQAQDWHSPMAMGQDPNQMPQQPQEQNVNPQAGNQQKPKGKGFSFTTPGTGDLLAAGLQFADAMIPEHQSRRIRPYNPIVSNNFSQGTGSQAIYRYGGNIYADGGEMDPNYTQRSYRKHNIQVTEEVPNQPLTLPEVDVYGQRVATPVNRNTVNLKGFDYTPTYNSYGQLDSYSISPYGYNNSQIPQLLNSLPPTYQGYPVDKSYEHFLNERTGPFNMHPGNIIHNYNQMTSIQPQEYLPFEYGGQTGGRWMGVVNDEPSMANGGSLSPEKAKQILKDGTAQGHPLTPKQKRYFGFIAGGGKAEYGAQVNDYDEDDMPQAKSGIHIKPSKKGTLHTALGVPKGDKIPASKLAIHSGDSPALKKKKQFALNARHWKHGENGLSVGQELELTPQQIEYYRSMGYDFE